MLINSVQQCDNSHILERDIFSINMYEKSQSFTFLCEYLYSGGELLSTMCESSLIKVRAKGK